MPAHLAPFLSSKKRSPPRERQRGVGGRGEEEEEENRGWLKPGWGREWVMMRRREVRGINCSPRRGR